LITVQSGRKFKPTLSRQFAAKGASVPLRLERTTNEPAELLPPGRANDYKVRGTPRKHAAGDSNGMESGALKGFRQELRHLWLQSCIWGEPASPPMGQATLIPYDSRARIAIRSSASRGSNLDSSILRFDLASGRYFRRHASPVASAKQVYTL
jgi:hypothetical protein